MIGEKPTTRLKSEALALRLAVDRLDVPQCEQAMAFAGGKSIVSEENGGKLI